VSEEHGSESGNNSNNGEVQESELWERISATDGVERAEVLAELSHFAYKRDDYAECIQLCETSIDLYQKSAPNSHVHELIHLHEGKALSLRNLEHHAEAAATFEEIARLQKERDEISGFIQAIRAAACEWYAAKEWQKSLEGHKAAQNAVDPESSDMSMAIDAINIGMCLNKLERFDEAVPHFIDSRKHFQKAKSPMNVSHVDNHLAISYIKLGNGLEAKFYAKHVYNYAKVAEDVTLQSYALVHLGKALSLCGEFEEAEEKFTTALEIFTSEENKDWEDIIEANRALADVLTKLGREDEAQERLEQLKTIEETMLDEG
jgi:tetratricopeptide (TPR) repeat protein